MINMETMEANVKMLKKLKEEQKILERKITAIEDEIKAVMNLHNTYEFEGEDWGVTWNMVTSMRFSQSRFKEDFPETFEKYKKLSESRRFNII